MLMIAPVVLGAGKRPFGEGTPAGTCARSSSALTRGVGRARAGGCLMATYELAGPVAITSFASPEPSPAELARRAAVAAGTW